MQGFYNNKQWKKNKQKKMVTSNFLLKSYLLILQTQHLHVHISV